MSVYYPEGTEQTFRATEGGLGIADITTDGTFQEVVIPAGIDGLVMAIQVQDIVKTTYYPDDDCYPFEWSHDGVEDGYLFDVYGKAVRVPKHGGDSLGFVKAVAGKMIVVYVGST